MLVSGHLCHRNEMVPHDEVTGVWVGDTSLSRPWRNRILDPPSVEDAVWREYRLDEALLLPTPARLDMRNESAASAGAQSGSGTPPKIAEHDLER